MNKLKSAKHHWWPDCVSKHWAASDGFTGWISPNGECKRVPPAKLGLIRDGHHIKLGRDPQVGSHWDTSFEHQFDFADSRFPDVIKWLDSLDRADMFDRELRDRFAPQHCADEQLKELIECVVSLAVRSPRNREASVGLAEQRRGPLASSERNALIGMNMLPSQRRIVEGFNGGGKFAVLFSSRKEFIFGDGFFHNVTAAVDRPHSPKILVPITPNISVIACRPMSFMTEPRMLTLVLSAEEVDACNHAVQVYSRNALFFKSEPPILSEAFSSGQHLQYARPDNPIDVLINAIPGIPPQDRAFGH